MKPRVSIGLLVFILVMASMVFVAAPMQYAWGMWGLALTELMLLAWGIIPALILKWDLREVFRIRIPSLRQVFGVLVLWLGGYIVVLAVSLVIFYLSPAGMNDISTQMLDMFTSVSFPIRLFILAVMPAICEEALHRGFILHTFKSNSKWGTIISMALIFGFFHLDPHRFLGTAILGAVLTFIMLETRNILLPVLFHLVNNAFSTFSTLITTPSAEVLEVPLASVGVIILLATVVPFLLIGGGRLLLSGEERKSRPVSRTTWIIAIVLTVVVALTGIIVTAVGAMDMLENFMA